MSRRNDMVTRWRKDTWYTVEIFNANTRKITRETRVAKGFQDKARISKAVKRTLPSDCTLVSVQIDKRVRRLYAMPEEIYYSNARVLDTEEVER